MTLVTLPYRTQLAAGQPEDISMVLADMDAILAVVNGDLRNDNIASAAAIVATKLNHPANIKQVLRGDGTWGYRKAVGAFYGYKASGTLSVTQNVYTKAALNAELFDVDNWFSTSTGLYTPQVAGLYWVFGQVYMGPGEADKQFWCNLSKNGTGNATIESGINWSDSADTNTCSCEGIIQMNGTTDTIQLDCYQGGTAAHNLNYDVNHTYLTGYLLGLT